MSIHVLREGHKLDGITMRYEEGGKFQVYKYGDREIKFDHTVTVDEVAAAFKDAK